MLIAIPVGLMAVSYKMSKMPPMVRARVLAVFWKLRMSSATVPVVMKLMALF